MSKKGFKRPADSEGSKANGGSGESKTIGDSPPTPPDLVADEVRYLAAVRDIIRTGAAETSERTGTGTFKKTGLQLRFGLSHTEVADLPYPSVPALTCRRLGLRWIVEELLFFMGGHFDTKRLEEKGVTIWSGNTSKEFLEERGLADRLRPGEMGAGYGWQWRSAGLDFWGDHRKHLEAFSGMPALRWSLFTDRRDLKVRDQLAEAFALLRTDPGSRRIIVNSWNPGQLDDMALPPCHYSFQFVTHLMSSGAGEPTRRVLDCVVTMRSGDLGLGIPFNAVSYSILTHIAACYANMNPGEVVINIADAHVYQTHAAFLAEDAEAPLYPRALPPKIVLSEKVVHLASKIAEMGEIFSDPIPVQYRDRTVRAASAFLDFVASYDARDVCSFEGYAPGPRVKMEMAV